MPSNDDERAARAALAKVAAELPSLYADPTRYDVLAQMTAPRDLPFYLELFEEHGGPVLELGAGTGRVALELARAGAEVVGVEVAEPMLALARAKAEAESIGLTLALGDLRRFDLGRPFRLVLLTYNTINHLLDLGSLRDALSTVRAHMDASSRFVIDTFQPSLAFLGDAPERPRPMLRYLDPYLQEEVRLVEENHYEPATQINRVRWRYTIGEREDAIVDEMRMRIFFPNELPALLELEGFEVEARYGDYDRTPFGSRSAKQLFVCRLGE